MGRRDSDGDQPASAEHRLPSRAALRHHQTHPRADAWGPFQFEYDDGNGLWISARETPSDQA